eukprot:jgi/Mesen1/708/ME000109S_10933
MVSSLLHHSGILPAATVQVVVHLTLIAIAAAATVYVAPLANGPGLPEIKGFLNGNDIPGFFQGRTILVKTIGMIAVVTAGLPTGREGPMVHIGAGIARAVLQCECFGLVKPGGNTWLDKDQSRAFATYGGAAGVAAAFNAPIGGVLFMFEEVSTFWTAEITFKSFVAATAGALVVKAGTVLLSGVVKYENFLAFSRGAPEASWRLGDVPFFLFLGLCGGLLSHLFTVVSLKVTKLRRGASWRKLPALKVLDACLTGVVVTLVIFCLPALFSCQHMPEGGADIGASPSESASAGPPAAGSIAAPEPHANSSLPSNPKSQEKGHQSDAALHHYVPYTCRRRGSNRVLDGAVDSAADGAHNSSSSSERHSHTAAAASEGGGGSAFAFNPMATLYLKGEEGAIKHLFSQEPGDQGLFSPAVLVAFSASYFFLAALISGLAVPTGQFIPQMLYGAALGRLFGLGVRGVVPGAASVGVFAHVGAASALAGYLHLSVSLAVMLMEASGDVSLLLPILIGIAVAKAVSRLLGPNYDEVMLAVKRIPYLDDKPPRAQRDLRAMDVMDGQVPQLLEREPADHVTDTLLTSPHSLFLVTDAAGLLRGVVKRVQLQALLHQHHKLTATRSSPTGNPHPRRLPSLQRHGSEQGKGEGERERESDKESDREGLASMASAETNSAYSEENCYTRHGLADLAREFRLEREHAHAREQREVTDVGFLRQVERAGRVGAHEEIRGAVGRGGGGGRGQGEAEAGERAEEGGRADGRGAHNGGWGEEEEEEEEEVDEVDLEASHRYRGGSGYDYGHGSRGALMLDLRKAADLYPFKVQPGMPILQVFPLMRKLNLSYICVVDDHGLPLGVIVRRDLLDDERMEASVAAWGAGFHHMSSSQRNFTFNRLVAAAPGLVAGDPDVLTDGDTVVQQRRAEERVNLSTVLAVIQKAKAAESSKSNFDPKQAWQGAVRTVLASLQTRKGKPGGMSRVLHVASRVSQSGPLPPGGSWREFFSRPLVPPAGTLQLERLPEEPGQAAVETVELVGPCLMGQVRGKKYFSAPLSIDVGFTTESELGQSTREMHQRHSPIHSRGEGDY